MDKSRRGWLAGILGLFGVGTVVNKTEAWTMQTDNTAKLNKRGFLCHRLDVGMLPPFKAEAFCERVKAEWRKATSLDCYDIVVVPTRPGSPLVGAVTLFDTENGSCGDYTGEEITQEELDNSVPEIDIPFIEPDPDRAADYVNLMLGFPVVKVELEQANLMWAYDETKHFFESMKQAKKLASINGAIDRAFKEMMLAKCQIMLGHIRNKFVPSPNGFALDGQALIEEGTEKLQYWYDRLM